jgi:hypothetical protein
MLARVNAAVTGRDCLEENFCENLWENIPDLFKIGGKKNKSTSDEGVCPFYLWY